MASLSSKFRLTKLVIARLFKSGKLKTATLLKPASKWETPFVTPTPLLGFLEALVYLKLE